MLLARAVRRSAESVRRRWRPRPRVSARSTTHGAGREPGPRATVLHLGVVGDVPGGMAQVVNEYLSWRYDDCVVSASATTRGPRDVLFPLRTLLSLARLVRLRSAPHPVAAVHLSQGGSFLREGAVIVAARALRIPVAAHLHGSSFDDYVKDHPGLVRAVLARTAVVLCLTSSGSAAVVRLFEASSGHRPAVVRVSNAVAPGLIASTKRRVVVMAGELGRRKGIDVAAAAWARVWPDHRDWALHLAGPLAAEHADAARLPGVVHLGVVSRARVLEELSTASIALLPSRHEAMPMFLLEAMTRRCAPVATRVGQVETLLADGSGLLTDPGDVDATVQALDLLMGDDATRDDVAGRAMQRVEDRFSPTTVAGALNKIWLTTALGGVPDAAADA